MDWIKTYEDYISFPMQCGRCFLDGQHTDAFMIVASNNGYALATCAEHREATGKVVADMQVDDDHQTKALFALHGAAIQDPRPEPGEGA